MNSELERGDTLSPLVYSDVHGRRSSPGDVAEVMAGFMQIFYFDLQRCVGQDGTDWE